MEKIVIHGGKPLKGDVRVSGAKNAALPLLFATLLAPGEHRLTNVPSLRDINTTKELLTSFGATVEDGHGTVLINSSGIQNTEAPYELVRTMRASILALGPLLSRTGKARVSLPGGCAIGARPIDLHLKGLEAMGADIRLENGYVEASAGRLVGADICLDSPSVGATENLMMAAVLASGTTRIENAAQEPEIVDLAAALSKMGAKISGAGSSVITIEGVNTLAPMDHEVMFDRIEAGTFMVAAAITSGDVLISGVDTTSLKPLMTKLRESGTQIEEVSTDSVRVIGPKTILPVDIKTMPHPGFPTDMQAQFMTLMALSAGTSMITESIFENRFMHVCELQRMGATISISGNSARVKGVKKLSGAPVMATDLRASASLILAGLSAPEKTVVSRIYHLDRGYDQIEKKLRNLGADITRMAS